MSPQSNIKSTQLADCAVAEGTTITEKTSMKNCIFGTNCVVNMKTRVLNSILMNGVVVEEGLVHITINFIHMTVVTIKFTSIFLCVSSVVIENCVVCDRVIIRSKSVLKNCLIGPGYEVASETTKEKAHLTNTDGFMEIE